MLDSIGFNPSRPHYVSKIGQIHRADTTYSPVRASSPKKAMTQKEVLDGRFAKTSFPAPGK
jgi:hypothetical protein